MSSKIIYLENLNDFELPNDVKENSSLYKVINKKTRKENFIYVGDKQVNNNTLDELKQIFENLQNYPNPAIINIYGYSFAKIKGKRYPSIITEYPSNLTLSKIQNKSYLKTFTNTKKYINFLGIALAMNDLHKHGIMHLNLNPDHIYLDSNFYPKIFSFDFSKLSKSEIDQNDSIYVAPELFSDNNAGPENDVYSFGMIAYTFFTGKIPKIECAKNVSPIAKQICDGKRPDTSLIKDRELVQFLEKCWAGNPSQRYNFETIVDQLLKGKYQKAFDGFDKKEVDNYIKLFNVKSDIDEVNQNEEFRKYVFKNTEENYAIKISSKQTVFDVIAKIKENFYDGDFDLFLNGQKLDRNKNFFDVTNGQKKIEMVPNSIDSNKSPKKSSSKRSLYTSDESDESPVDLNEPIGTKKKQGMPESLFKTSSNAIVKKPLFLNGNKPPKTVEYLWDFIDVNQKKKEVKFTFPLEFTAIEAIKQIEEEFENKYKIQIGKGKKIIDDDTILNKNKTVKMTVIQSDIKYSFVIKNSKESINKKFKYDDKLSEIISYLFFNENNLGISFCERDGTVPFEEPEKLEFNYKGNIYSCEDTFESIHYNYHDSEKIVISYNIPLLVIYSPLKIRNIRSQKDKVNTNDVTKMIKKKDKDQIDLYKNFEPFDDKTILIKKGEFFDYFTYKLRVGFHFNLLDDDLDDYFIDINDEDITVDEIKSILASYISSNKKSCFSPKSIILTYKNKEVNSLFFKDIKYVEGKFIDVSIEIQVFHVKIKDEIFECEVENQDFIVADLQRLISTEIQYQFDFNGKILNGYESLKGIITSKKKYINATEIKSLILTYEGNDFNLDKINLNDTRKLREKMIQDYDIDVDNCYFVHGKKKIGLDDFKNLQKISKVEAFYIGRKKFNNFVKEKYHNILYRDQTVDDFRQVAINMMKRKFPICIKCGKKYLLGQTKLFKIDGKIEIQKMKSQFYTKKFFMKTNYLKRIIRRNVASQDFRVDDRVISMKKFICQTITDEPFKLVFDGEELDDFNFIHEVGDEIDIEFLQEIQSDEKVKFIIYHPDAKPLSKPLLYSENKSCNKYKKELGLKDDYIFCTNKKILLNDFENLGILKDEEIKVVHAYPYSMIPNFEKNDDVFNFTHKSVIRVEKKKEKIDKIMVLNADFSQSENFDKDQVEVKLDGSLSPKTILDLRKIVAKRLRCRDINKISLFILFSMKDGADFALLSDDEKIEQILLENPDKSINYKVLTNDNHFLPPKLLKRYKKYAQDQGLNLTDQEIKNIYIKVDHDINQYLATVDYLLYKNNR